jgi:hypothetical protein
MSIHPNLNVVFCLQNEGKRAGVRAKEDKHARPFSIAQFFLPVKCIPPQARFFSFSVILTLYTNSPPLFY